MMSQNRREELSESFRRDVEKRNWDGISKLPEVEIASFLPDLTIFHQIIHVHSQE